MDASIIIIGDEILKGKIADSNAFFLSQQLLQLGYPVGEIRIISDCSTEIFKTLEAMKKYDLVFITGGLGPTIDDLTKNTLSDFFQQPLVSREDVLSLVEKHYRQLNKIYDPQKSRYHHFLKDAHPLYNPSGLAPGIAISGKSTQWFALPGVPHEMQNMFLQAVLPKIKKKSAKTELLFRTFSQGEEALCQQVWPEATVQLAPYGRLSFLPHPYHVDVGIELHQSKQKLVVEKIVANSPWAPFIWSRTPESITEKLIELLKTRGESLGLAESCTGGNIASEITNTPGSSLIFDRAFITYSPESKREELGVSTQIMEKNSLVSSAVAEAMLKGVFKNTSCDYALATTGYFDHPPSFDLKRAGHVYLAWGSREKSEVQLFKLTGHRKKMKLWATSIGLFSLYHFIKNSKNGQ